MASAMEELRKRVYGNTGGATSAPSVSSNNQSSLSRLQDIVYRGAPYTVKTPVQKPVTAPVVTENNTPTLGERLTNILTGSIKSAGSQYASALGTTQAVTGGVARENYLTRDAEQLKKDKARYEYELKHADEADKNYWQMELDKVNDALAMNRTGLEETKTAGQSAQKKAYDLDISAAKDIERAKEGTNALGSFLVDAGVSGIQLAGDLALGALTRTGSLAMGLRRAGGAAQEARQSGATLGEQVAYGVGSGVLSAAVERISNAATPLKKVFGAGIVDDAVRQAAGKLGQTAAGKIALSAIGEGGEEFVEAMAQPLLQKMTYDKSANYDKEWLTDALYNAAIGAVLGGVVGGGDVVVNKARTATGNALQKAVETDLQSRGEALTDAEGKDIPPAQRGAEGKGEAVKVGRATVIQHPYSGTVPQQNAKSAEAVLVNNNSVQAAKNRIDGAKGLEKAVPGQGFKSALKQAYKSIFTPTKGVEVEDVTFDGQPYLVDINNNVPGKVISDGDLTAEKLALLDVLPEIVRRGEYVGSGQYVPHGSRNKPVVRYDYFETVVHIGGGQYVARFDVEAYPAVNNYRTHKIINVDLTSSEGRLAGQTPVPSSDASRPPYDLTVPQQSDLVKEDRSRNQDNSPRAMDNNFTAARPQGNTVGSAQSGFSPYTAAMNQYGTLPGGENPVRPDDVPLSTDGTDRVSQTVVTAIGAQVTPDEFVPLIENQTVKGGFSFIPITNSETVATAKARIVEYGWVNALTNWTKALHSGKASPVLAAEGALLYNHAVNSGNYQQAMDILSEYAELERRAARTTQAARIMKTLSPDSRLYMINRDIQKLVDNMGLQNPIKLPDALVKTYMDAKTDAEMNDAVDAIAQYVADQIPSTMLDKWTALRYLNMLGNFKTPVRNEIGNALMAATAEASNAVSVLGQKATGGKFGKTRTFTVSKEMREAAKADFDDPSNTTWNEGKYTLRNQNASALERAVRDKQTVFTGVLSPLESYRQATNWAMNNAYFGDTAWMKAAYSRYLGGWLEANGYTAAQLSDPKWREINADVLDQARAFAKKQAEEITFRDSNWLSDWVSSLGRKPSTPKLVRAVSEGVLPFRKTPANVMMRAAEYSPLGLLKSAVDAVRVSRGSDAVTGEAVLEEIAKGLTGTGMLALGMWLSSMGLIRGKEDEDEKQAGFDDLVGRQPYAMELGDTSITIDWAAPVAVPVLMGTQLYELIYENGFQLKDLERVLTGIADPLISMSMLQGAEDLLTSVQYTEGSSLMQIVLSAAVNYLAQGLTNSLIGQVERIAENESTMNYVDQNSILPGWLQKDIGKISRKLPGVDLFQTAYIDAWGRTEEQEDLAARAFNALFNPAYVSNVDVDNVERELQRLYNATGENVFPQRADKRITVNQQNIDLSAEQYDKYARRLGKERYRMVKAATSTSAYRKLSDADKAAVISKCYSAARAKTIREQFPDYELPNSIKNYVQADANGTDLATYYASKH